MIRTCRRWIEVFPFVEGSSFADIVRMKDGNTDPARGMVLRIAVRRRQGIRGTVIDHLGGQQPVGRFVRCAHCGTSFDATQGNAVRN
jgi:hypothetical protein